MIAQVHSRNNFHFCFLCDHLRDDLSHAAIAAVHNYSDHVVLLVLNLDFLSVDCSAVTLTILKCKTDRSIFMSRPVKKPL